jgi:(4S)-4-hydroxy-5-phosphonooxypentane-2,3-dione isomerase
MIVQVVYLEVQPDKLTAFLEEATYNARESLRERGVTQFDLLQQYNTPMKFVLYEVFRNNEALEAHRLTPHYKRWVEVGVPMLIGERVRVLYKKVFPE